MKLFSTRNPYVLVRKNYRLLFKKFFKNRNITPLLFNFLHLAYFKFNKNRIYRPRLITKLDNYATRLFKFNLLTYKQKKFSPYKYLFILMKKKTHFQKIFDLYDKRSKYNLNLHQLYFFQQARKSDFKLFSFCPPSLNIAAEEKPFFEHDFIRPYEQLYIRRILNFFYPVTEIHFKENHIHGKPMKTKLPRRI